MNNLADVPFQFFEHSYQTDHVYKDDPYPCCNKNYASHKAHGFSGRSVVLSGDLRPEITVGRVSVNEKFGTQFLYDFQELLGSIISGSIRTTVHTFTRRGRGYVWGHGRLCQ